MGNSLTHCNLQEALVCTEEFPTAELVNDDGGLIGRQHILSYLCRTNINTWGDLLQDKVLNTYQVAAIFWFTKSYLLRRDCLRQEL